jgi:hypothetical protein
MSSNDDLEGADMWGDSSNDNDNNNNDDDNKDATHPSSNNEEGKVSEESTATATATATETTTETTATAAASRNENENQDMLDDEETRSMSISELRQRIHLLDNDIRVMKSDCQRISHESRTQEERIKENQEKVKVNKQLPYLVGNVVEVLEPEAEDGKHTA